MSAPELSTVPPFYHNYIRKVSEEPLAGALALRFRDLTTLLQPLDESAWSHAYAPGKWSIKELVQHVIDTERIFSYRALCIARRDPNPLPGFDENAYAAASDAGSRSGSDILKELESLNAATSLQFKAFNESQLAARGISNGAPISVNAIGYILAGHALHHTAILRERYLSGGGEAGSGQ
jgi:hypothetical protein